MRRIALFAGCAALVASSGCFWGVRGLAVYATTTTLGGASGSVRSDAESGAAGDTIDLANDLGVESVAPWQARIEIIRRRDQWGLGLGYGTASFSSSAVSSGPVNFGEFNDPDLATPPDLRLDPDEAEILLNEYRLELTKYFRSRSERYALYLGVVGAEWNTKLTNVTTPATEETGALAFVPVVGLRYWGKLGPLACWNLRGEWMDVALDEMAVSVLEWSATVGLKTPNLSVEVGYGSRAIDLDWQGQRLGYGGEGLTFAVVSSFILP